MYWQCTYLGFGLLEAPHEYVLHGPLLAMYWLRLCPHSREPALEAMFVRRRLFIVLMTPAHISPNVFSLHVFLTNVQWTSYYITQQRHTSILYITFIHTFTSSYYTSHSYVHSHLHFSALRSRLAALDSLCLIHWWFYLSLEWVDYSRV